MKIHIIGGSGSGKSTLAAELSRQYGLPRFDLDELFWANGFESRRDAAERQRLLDAILANGDWITEGVYYIRCQRCFAEADRIYILCVPRRVYRARIIRRFLRRKCGLEEDRGETLRSLGQLLRWADRYQREDLPKIRALLAPFQDKVSEIHAK